MRPLMHRGERQLHLPLHSRNLRDPEPRGLPGGVAQERRLADAGLATNDQDGALATAYVRQQAVEHLALAVPAQETPRREAAAGCDVGAHR